MSFGLGFWAAAGAGGGGGSATYELIQTVNASGSVSTITFSSIPSTYKHLQLRISARSTQASYGVDMPIRFNGDSGNNYAGHTLYATGNQVNAENSTSRNSLWIQNLVANANDANITTAFVIDILDYGSASKNKTARIFQGSSDSNLQRVNLSSSFWNSTAAITSIDVSTAANFNSISRFSLYGIKG